LFALINAPTTSLSSQSSPRPHYRLPHPNNTQDLVAAMATAMPPSSFSTSTSSFRASQSQTAPVMSYTDSPLTQLPSVDFNFDDLRRRMAEFTIKFDAFIEQGRKRVLEERNEFRARLGELHGE
jgi:hypothetical protein